MTIGGRPSRSGVRMRSALPFPDSTCDLTLYSPRTSCMRVSRTSS